MNFNICQKCERKGTKYFIAISPPNYNQDGTVILSSSRGSNKNCFMIDEHAIKDLSSFFNFREKERYIDFNEIKTLFPNVTVNKICPFYFEHQLSDWNEK